MNWLDYLLVFVFILNLFNGFRYGLVHQVVGMASFVIAGYFALFWNSDVKGYLKKLFNLNEFIPATVQNGETPLWLSEIILNIIAFLVVFFLISVVLGLITGKLKILNKVPIIGPLNALAGSLLGALKGLLIIFLITAILSLIETEFWINTVEASVVVALSRYYMPLLFSLIVDFIMGRLGKIV